VPPQLATSGDGARIAYDVTGSGPPVLLLHGGGQTRRAWHDAGYVSRLSSELTVICVDLRGNGDSDKPDAVDRYAIDHLVDDILAVADAAGAQTFALWGFSYGANIGRYVAVRTGRVRSMVYIGIPFGSATPGPFREMILGLRTKWTPVVAAHRDGTFDDRLLSDDDRRAWQRGAVPVTLAWLGAMLDYPIINPADMPCPTLWLVGSANADAMASATAHKAGLDGTEVSLTILDGLTHAQELERVDVTLPHALAFTRAHGH
jgi:pimeloyl-ACP methyl ester carboxylesterase